MPRTTTKPTEAHTRYWGKRLLSPVFKRALTDTLARELQLLAQERVADVLDAERIRAAIHAWDTRLVDRARLAELIIDVNRRLTARLRGRHESLLDVLGRQALADIEALLTEGSGQAEEFVGDIMRQEFVRRLFTDIVFTAIVSFNRKVNPLFGGLAMRMLEDQIKGFIRLFMPMLIEQATAFAVSKDNQRLALDFARQVVRQLLDRPLSNFALADSPGQRKKVEAAIRKAVADTRLEGTIRRAALTVWDDLYAALRDERVGDLVALEKHARPLATQCVDAILPVLARPHIVELIAAEAALAAMTLAPGPSPKPRKEPRHKASVPVPSPGKR